MKSLVANLQRLSLALLAVIVVVFGSFTVLTPTASAEMYVGNLSDEVKQDDVTEVFKKYGEVIRVYLPTDTETRRTKGFAFVKMSTDAEETAAIINLDGEEFMGRDLKVNKAKPKENRGCLGREWVGSCP